MCSGGQVSDGSARKTQGFGDGCRKGRHEVNEMGQSRWVVAHFRDPPEPSISLESVCNRAQLNSERLKPTADTALGHTGKSGPSSLLRSEHQRRRGARRSAARVGRRQG